MFTLPLLPSELLLLLCFLPFMSGFCSSFTLHHHQPFSLTLSLSLSLSLPCFAGLLHNIQLYLLQLRILIFPMRKESTRAKKGEERVRKEAGPDLPNLPHLVNSITGPINVIWKQDFVYWRRRTVLKAYALCALVVLDVSHHLRL